MAVNPLRRRLQPLTWIALVAVLSLALLPTVSHALAFVQGYRAPWAEVCSAQRGPRVVAGSDGGAPLTAHAAVEHCAWCGLTGADLVLPPDAPYAALTAEAGELPAMASAMDAGSRRTWAPALPRAPPSCA